MKKQWSILYRGSLSSCNYSCVYCPFAKTKNTREELEQDAQELQRFVTWVKNQNNKQIGILFTPWGEAIIRKHYQKALVELSHLPHVNRVAIQTNISGSLDWIKKADKNTLALWATYHPTQISRDQFIKTCQFLDQNQVRYSVGIVGLKENFAEMEALRAALAPQVYLWVNAFKREPDYYSQEDLHKIKAIDPLFEFNTHYYDSFGKDCKTGDTVFSVDGEGNMRRCHFIKKVIGNIYQPDFEQVLYRRTCTNQSCGCHIGYVHMDELKLYEVYGEGLLERIPESELRM